MTTLRMSLQEYLQGANRGCKWTDPTNKEEPGSPGCDLPC